MAASTRNNQSLCLMCLDSPAVRKVGTCQHSYCNQCLSSHIEGQLRGMGEMFPCPACRTQCQLEARASGDKDASVSTVKDEPSGGGGIQLDGEVQQALLKVPTLTGRDRTASLVNADCKLCNYRGTKVKAVNACEECKKLLLCANCTQAHHKNRSTQKHVVTSLASLLEREEELCNAHGEQLDLFCVACSENVCHVCLSLDHVDHDIKAFSDVVHKNVEEVRSALEYEEKRLNTLEADERESQQSKTTAEEMERALLEAIEKHAEKCIEKILTNKDALKEKVRGDFNVVGELKEHIEKVAGLIRESKEVVSGTREVLDEQAELHSRYVVKLAKAKTQLDKLKEGTASYEEDKKKRQRNFERLKQNNIQFNPRNTDWNIGRVEATGMYMYDEDEELVETVQTNPRRKGKAAINWYKKTQTRNESPYDDNGCYRGYPY